MIRGCPKVAEAPASVCSFSLKVFAFDQCGAAVEWRTQCPKGVRFARLHLGSDALARARQAKRTRFSLPKKPGRKSFAQSSAPSSASGPDEPPTSAPSSISGGKEEAVAASGKASPEEAKTEAATAARLEGSAADVTANRASSDCNSQPVGGASSQAGGSSESV